MPPDYADGLALAGEGCNTLGLRTFSKIHRLAGLRCGWGWGYGPAEIIDTLHKVRGAFNVSAVAQAAAAAAVADDRHERQAREHNTQWLAWLNGRLTRAGLSVVPSVCNFLVVVFADAQSCQAAGASLVRHGVLAMPLTGYGLPHAMCITIGTEAANRAVARALTEDPQ